MPENTQYRQSVDLGGQNDRISACVELIGSDERVKEALGRLHAFLGDLKAEMQARETAGEARPCEGCGEGNNVQG